MPPKTNEDYEKITIAMCDDIIEAITNRIKWKDGVLNIFDVVEPHIKTILNAKDKEREEAVKRVSYEIVKEFKDNLITIAIENEHMRGCVTSNQIIKAFEDFGASTHDALTPPTN